MLDVDPVTILVFSIAIAVALSATAAVIGAVIGSRSHYDAARREMAISALRSEYEQRIEQLYMKMMASRERWEEGNELVSSAQSAISSKFISEVDPESIPLFRELNISGHEISIDQDLVFVVTPFRDSEDQTFKTIKNSCESLGLTCIRGDEEYVQGLLISHIVRLIAKSRLIIVNLNGRNPNVFYELGIAHTLGKTNILVSRAPEDIPVDVSSQLMISYKNLRELEIKLSDALVRITRRRPIQTNS